MLKIMMRKKEESWLCGNWSEGRRALYMCLRARKGINKKKGETSLCYIQGLGPCKLKQAWRNSVFIYGEQFLSRPKGLWYRGQDPEHGAKQLVPWGLRGWGVLNIAHGTDFDWCGDSLSACSNWSFQKNIWFYVPLFFYVRTLCRFR